MAYYETDAEQVEKLRKWWKEYGWAITIGIIAAIIIVVGWQVYGRYQQHRAQQASLIYATMMSNAHDNDNQSAVRAANRLIKDFSGTAYADLAYLWQAKYAVSQRRYDQALTDLQRVQAHGSMSAFRQMATLSRAEILLELKRPAQALAALGQIYDRAYTPRVDEMRGDIYFSTHDNAQARQWYLAAADAYSALGVPAPFIAMKLASVPYQSANSA